MEEAIAVLEKRVEIDRALRDGSVESDYDKFCENECLAIEKLIKGYKLEKLKNVLDEQSLKEALEDYVPKSRIKEKIEELKECVECLGNDGMELTYKESAEAQIQVLQELLEE